ncbi:hypothetical protein SAMN05216184_102343 [Georgenia satyanarayanai]|uniref:Uncharacterized protein n=2 Tax=Georgenia satyanarayanai TaxID=860221 RepID=A0A2Y9A674_9MICO|nr:hypothetical protein A8987_102343 [Georgenia satyanarayanai]SSA39416.1 hypothetical protein SAMN05216184_102343 [Georgenia satyanarayanai]
MVPVAIEPDEHQSRRALVLLALFVLGCAVVAAGAALGLGTVWQDVHEWVFARVAGDRAV